jgi:hypothetical protein
LRKKHRAWNDARISSALFAQSNKEKSYMSKLLSGLMLVALVIASNAQAAGCTSRAVVGGATGHVAGKHAVAGAAAGCAVGHHEANKKSKAASHAAAASGASGG